MRSSAFLVVGVLSSLALGIITTMPAKANLTIGGADARKVGMGGSGLAVRSNDDEIPTNVALLAESGARFNINTPTFDMRVNGATQEDAQGLLGQYILNPAKAFNLAIDLGKQDTEIITSVTAGIQLPQSNISGWATIDAKIVPNAAYQTWANSGGLLVPFLAGAKADVYAVGLVSAPVSVGVHLPGYGGEFDFGVRVKPIRAYYSHYIIDKDSIANKKPLLAPEMGDNNYLVKDSIAADIGVFASPPGMGSLRMAATVNNLIRPQAIDFKSPSATGMVKQEIEPTTVNVGIAIEDDHFTLAADLLDVTRQLGGSQLCLGAELRPTHSFALRAGYSQGGVSYGLGLGNFSIAITGNDTLAIGQLVKF